MRKFKTKLLLSSIAISAISLSSQASIAEPLVPALKSSVSSKASTNSVAFPPVVTQYMLTSEREAPLILNLSSFDTMNPGYRAEFEFVEPFAYTGYYYGGVMNIIPLQFGSFALNINIVDISTGSIVDVQNYSLIVNETSKFTVSKLPTEIELEIGEATSLELVSNWRYRYAEVAHPTNFDSAFVNDAGRIYAVTGSFKEPGVYYVDTRVESYNNEVDVQTVKYVVKDSLAPDLEVVDTNYLTTHYNETLEIDLSKNITGRYDQILIHKGADFGSISLNGDTATYYAPSEQIHNLDNFRVEVIDSLTNTHKFFDVNIRVEAIAPQVADFSINGDRYNEFVIDFSQHITKGTFDITDLVVTSYNGGTLTKIGTHKFSFLYNGSSRAAETLNFTYFATGNDGSNSDFGNVTVKIPAALDVALSDNDISVHVGTPIDLTFAASGGTDPYTYEVSGYYPSELSLVSGNRITGTPAYSGRYEVFVRATDANGEFAEKTYTIEISDVDAVLLPPLNLRGKVGNHFTQAFIAEGGSEPYTYELLSPLPAGLTLSGNTVSGTPEVDGSFSFQLQATDKNGVIGSQTYSISVAPADAVVELPIVENGTLELDYGQSGTIDLASLVTGEFDSISVIKKSEKGDVSLSGNTATFTPEAGVTGSDRFDFIAVNAAGSVTGSVLITIKEPVGEAPIAINHVISLDPTKSGSIDLTSGAISSDPILKSHVLNSTSAKNGKIELSGLVLDFQPHRAFAGNVVIGYQLENKFGRSNVATVTFKVAERPDPSKDPEVVALIRAQVDSAIKLADDQIDNIIRRLEQIRSEAPGKRKNSFDLTIGVDGENDETRLHDGTEIENKQSQNVKTDFQIQNPIAGWFTGYVRVGDDEFSGLDFKTTAVGFTAGADYRFNDNFVGGVTLGYGREHSNIGSNGTENVATALSAALYGSWHSGSGAFVDGLIGYQKLDMESTRFVTPNSQFAYGSRSGSVVFGSVIAGYDFKAESGLKITPYAGVRGISGKLDGFSEDGGDIYGLTYGSTDIRSISGVAGLGVEKTFESDDWTITPTAKLEYRYDFASGTRTNIGYTDIISDVGMPYVVHTDVDQRSTVVASAGVRVKPKNSDLTLEAAVQGNVNGNSKSVRFSAKATYNFCGIGAKKTDCMSLEQRVVYLKAELAKAQKAKNKQKISELKKLLVKSERELKAFNKRSSQLTPVPDPDYTFRLK